uniref:Uncharacterized protein n=1 Tax=Arundo donax TaxID=35708 RepID=A0A0A8ZXZ2_ARUDO
MRHLKNAYIMVQVDMLKEYNRLWPDWSVTFLA